MAGLKPSEPIAPTLV